MSGFLIGCKAVSASLTIHHLFKTCLALRTGTLPVSPKMVVMNMYTVVIIYLTLNVTLLAM